MELNTQEDEINMDMNTENSFHVYDELPEENGFNQYDDEPYVMSGIEVEENTLKDKVLFALSVFMFISMSICFLFSV